MAVQPPQRTDRPALVAQLAQARSYDVVVVGGGATGLGVALDAAVRGLSVLLLEAHDFAKGTSSRSTKLVHGGVRYLARGQIHLVREALRERALLLANAPHLAQPLPFVIPTYHWWEPPYYALGLKLYDVLSGRHRLGRTELLSREQALQALPTARKAQLGGGVQYWDGQFNDARLAVTLARTAARHGALLLNYCRVDELVHAQGRIAGLVCVEQESAQRFEVRTRCVVNATGVWVDALRQQDTRLSRGDATVPVRPVVAPSQGVHLVVDREFLPGPAALMVPRTADGRVLFAVPWLGKLILGTTDTPRQDLPLEPRPLDSEVDFILAEAARYLSRTPARADVRSAWVGLRPLIRTVDDEGGATRGLSREHAVLVSPSGLVTVTGGKWTTYRAMAQDVLAKCGAAGLLDAGRSEVTAHLKLVGAPDPAGVTAVSEPEGLHQYGSEQDEVQRMPGAQNMLAPGLSEAMVRFAARHEYARTVEDVLARRSRLLFLDARAAGVAAPAVADILAQETGVDPGLATFQALAEVYASVPAASAAGATATKAVCP